MSMEKFFNKDKNEMTDKLLLVQNDGTVEEITVSQDEDKSVEIVGIFDELEVK